MKKKPVDPRAARRFRDVDKLRLSFHYITEELTKVHSFLNPSTLKVYFNLSRKSKMSS